MDELRLLVTEEWQQLAYCFQQPLPRQAVWPVAASPTPSICLTRARHAARLICRGVAELSGT
jgi:hypothetical protein